MWGGLDRIPRGARRSVSRVLSRPKAGMAIHLGRSSPNASRDRPERRRERPARQPRRCRSCLPLLLGLAPGGVFPATAVAGGAVRSYRTISPLPPMRSHEWAHMGSAVCFLWHFPWGRPRRALPGTVPPWSPDFPPPCEHAKSGHPTVWHGIMWEMPPAIERRRRMRRQPGSGRRGIRRAALIRPVAESEPEQPPGQRQDRDRDRQQHRGAELSRWRNAIPNIRKHPPGSNSRRAKIRAAIWPPLMRRGRARRARQNKPPASVRNTAAYDSNAGASESLRLLIPNTRNHPRAAKENREDQGRDLAAAHASALATRAARRAAPIQGGGASGEPP